MSSVSGASGLQGIQSRLRGRFQEWVNRRIPPAKEITLDQRRIFIFPNRTTKFSPICFVIQVIKSQLPNDAPVVHVYENEIYFRA